jgi:hypothetical protein
VSLLSRIFPETIFPRKLDPAAERRLRLAQARAEEALIDAHVQNTLMFVDALAEDMSFDRAIDTYIRVMNVAEPLASTVATRVLVVLGEELMPERQRTNGAPASVETEERPAIRIGQLGSGS